MKYYHRLVYGSYGDLHTVKIPPDSVPLITRKIANKQPINLSNNAVVLPGQVKEFEPSDIPFGEENLLEEASRAFNEPLHTSSGLASKWVKKTVTMGKFEKFYSISPGYHPLAEINGMMTVAFKLPVHVINQQITPYCTDNEVLTLTRRD